MMISMVVQIEAGEGELGQELLEEVNPGPGVFLGFTLKSPLRYIGQRKFSKISNMTHSKAARADRNSESFPAVGR